MDEPRTEQLGLGLQVVVGGSVEDLVGEEHRGSVEPTIGGPVVAVVLLSRPLREESSLVGAVLVKGKTRALVQVRVVVLEALLHQVPEVRPRVAVPGVWPEGHHEGLGLIHQRRQGFLRVH